MKNTTTQKPFHPAPRAGLFALPFFLALTACSTPLTQQTGQDDASTRDYLKTIIADQKANVPAVASLSNFTEQTGPSISIKPLSRDIQAAKEKEWLTNIRGITLDPAKNAAIPASAIIRMFRDKGINIVTSLPLDLYSYNGYGVTNVNAETALMVFLGAMGLDYEIDNARQLITIEPMKPQTWIFNIGNRKTNFSTDGTSGTGAAPGQQSPGSGQQTGGQNGSMSILGSGANMAGNTQPGATTQSSPSNSATGNGNGITSSDDVWSKLSAELNQRLTILVPKNDPAKTGGNNTAIVPGLTQNPGNGMPGMGMGTPMPGMDTSGTSLYNTQTVGRFAINAETGAITVQAPKYILKTLNEYLTKVQEMYNTTITFEGELVTVTTNKNVSEGIDWSAFNTFSNGRYTSIAQNNALGGVVMSGATGTGSIVDAVTIGNTSLPGAGTVFGIASATKKFAALNAFLTSIGQLKIKDTPLVTTTSGAPVRFKNTVTRHYPQYQATAASTGIGNAVVAQSTISVPYDTGMTLRLNPRYDVHTGLVRTQFSLDRTMLNGWEQQQNPVTIGGVGQIITSRLPILASTLNDGELLLRNGDLVVVGGLTEDSEDNSDEGVSGLIDTPFKALTGKGMRNKSTTTYYFALRVTVTNKSN